MTMSGRKILKVRINCFILCLYFITIFSCALPITVAFDHGVEIKGPQQKKVVEDLVNGSFSWMISQPIMSVNPINLPPSTDNPWVAVKDPSIVRYDGLWHLFCTLRKHKGKEGQPPGYIRIGYTSFENWKDAQTSKWHLLTLSQDYHAAPQIFYFTPHKKWYLIFQLADKSRNIPYGPCYSTTEDISDPDSWTLPTALYPPIPGKAGLDHWIICDETKAYHLFTTLDGKMWRTETELESFPRGFGRPEIALHGDIYEASHTYRLKGLNKYLAIIEARSDKRRYYKAYLADRLDGQWTPLAATKDNPFASLLNVQFIGPNWTDSISHGELIRDGYDQSLEVDPANLRFLFQGISNEDRKGKAYGDIPWQLGILTSY